jgi:hypothetical protein
VRHAPAAAIGAPVVRNRRRLRSASSRAPSVLRPVYSVCVSHRPLAIVSGITIGDYLLWNWSLNANHDVLALASGLTLPPITIAFVWLLALTVARLIARSSRNAAHLRARAHAGSGGLRTRRAGGRREDAPAAAQGQPPASPSASPTPARPSRKIAA